MTISRFILLMLGICLVATPVAVQARTFKVATISPDGLGWIRSFREGVHAVDVETDGRVKFKIYPGGVQGDDYTVLRKMRIGQLHGGAVAAGVLTRFYPDVQVYGLPLQFRNFEEVDFVRTRMDERVIGGLADAGIKSFWLTETGFAYIMSKQPVRGVEDLAKLKVWVPDGDPISAKLLDSFGISPIPLPMTDVLTGLQTGLVDTVAVPPLVALALQWHTQVKYVTDMPLLYIYSMLALDKKAFDRVSDADRTTATGLINDVFKRVDDANRADNVTAYDALLNQGIESVAPSVEQLAVWRGLADKSIDSLVAGGALTAEGVAMLRELLSTTRSHQASGAD
jgi:TRAP-type C4-dicarboxylate transport system substrate-binding protein